MKNIKLRIRDQEIDVELDIATVTIHIKEEDWEAAGLPDCIEVKTYISDLSNWFILTRNKGKNNDYHSLRPR